MKAKSSSSVILCNAERVAGCVVRVLWEGEMKLI